MRTVRPRAAVRLFALAMVAAATVCLVLAVAGVAAAASPSPVPAASASPGLSVFRMGTLENVDTLNPFIGYSGVDYLVYHLNYDFLVGFDPAKLEPRPEFAESWSHSADGKTWTFKIRPGMTWQDGQPATARDVAFTFNYIMKNDLTNFTSYTTLLKSVSAPDNATVVFQCSKPKADILQMKVPILPQHIWSKVPGPAASTSFTNPPAVIGSGPYQVVERKNNSFARLVANPHYWRGRPPLDEIIIETYQDANSMAQDLKMGALDGCTGVPPAQFKGLSSSAITTNPSTSWSFEQLSFNCSTSPGSTGNPVLRDSRFRQALQYAVDRTKNALIAYDGYCSPGGTLLPPYSEFNWQPPAGQAYTYDPAKAQAMLDAAGYKDVNGDGYRETPQGKPLSLRLYTDAQTPENITTSKLVMGWLKAVGVKARLSVLDPGTLSSAEANYKGKVFAPDFDLVVWWWEGDAESPQFILSLLTPGQIGGWSDTSWADPQYTSLWNQESTTIDTQARIAMVKRMQQIAYQSSPYVIFGYPQFLESYNTAKWAGYVKEPGAFPGYNGNAFYYDTFLKLRPATAAGAGGGSSTTWVVAVVGAAIVIMVAVILVMRRRGRAGQEFEAAE
jgi:peptide/nickel transport system substrate-binding protein